MMSEMLGATNITVYLVEQGDYYEPVDTAGMVQAIIAGDTELAFTYMLKAWKLQR